MKPHELYEKVKGNRSALHTLMTFIGYTKPNYDRLKAEIEKMLGVDADNLSEEFVRLVADEYFKYG